MKKRLDVNEIVEVIESLCDSLNIAGSYSEGGSPSYTSCSGASNVFDRSHSAYACSSRFDAFGGAHRNGDSQAIGNIQVSSEHEYRGYRTT
jgi:hypothetical protein